MKAENNISSFLPLRTMLFENNAACASQVGAQTPTRQNLVLFQLSSLQYIMDSKNNIFKLSPLRGMLFDNNAIPHCILCMSSPNLLLGEMQHCFMGVGEGKMSQIFRVVIEKLWNANYVYCCTIIANINTQMVQLFKPRRNRDSS